MKTDIDPSSLLLGIRFAFRQHAIGSAWRMPKLRRATQLRPEWKWRPASCMENITLDLVLDRLTTKDVLRGVLHAILFHRLFGTIKPRIIEILDVTVPGVDDPDIEHLVDEKVDAFWKGAEGGTNKRGQIVVTFAEKRPKKTWFSTGEEEVPWEHWTINAEIMQPNLRDRLAFDTNVAATLNKTLQTILTHTSSEEGRAAVPLITNATGISPFPVKVTVKVGGIEIG